MTARILKAVTKRKTDQAEEKGDMARLGKKRQWLKARKAELGRLVKMANSVLSEKTMPSQAKETPLNFFREPSLLQNEAEVGKFQFQVMIT